jgi:hypothetical protein
MKKFLFYCFILSIAAQSAMAQRGLSGCTSATTPSGNIVFLGIDYSLARFSYIAESATYVIRTIPEINRLFIIEPKKYDVGKLMKKSVTKVDLNYVLSLNEQLSADRVILHGDYRINENDVKALIANYPDDLGEGTGLVFVAEQMDKRSGFGSYYVTFFDMKTKEVLTTCRRTGKPGGIGLRNFWAATVYNMMKNWK